MEHIESSEQTLSLDDVRNRLHQIKEQNADPHFKTINVETLPNEDLELVRKFWAGTLTVPEFEQVREAYIASHLEADMNDSRANLFAWLGNQVFIRDLKKNMQ